MKCKDIKEMFIEYVDGILSSDDTLEVEKHLSSCESCSKELSDIKALCLDLGDIELEHPSETLKNEFNSMVNGYIRDMDRGVHAVRHEKASNWLANWLPKRPLIQVTAAIAVLTIGLAAGLHINRISITKNEIVNLQTDIDQLRQTVMTSLLNQSSVSERINGLSMTGRLESVNQQFLSTLLLLLNSDSNVNVRLAAVNALSKYANDEYVRNELVKSLGLQSSPLIQISLIDLLSSLREYDSYSALMRIIDNPDSNNHVKKRAKSALNSLVSFKEAI